MARWHLSSGPELHARASELSEEAGLLPVAEHVEHAAFLRTYRKRAVASSNFARVGDDGWIAVAGTLIHGGALGESALPRVHDTLATDLDGARSQLLGHYAVAAMIGGRIHVFTDEQGSLTLYFGARGSEWVVSNSLQVVAASLGILDVDNPALLDYILDWESVGPGTFFPGVRRLFGTERLIIDPSDGSVTVARTRAPMQSLSAAAHESVDAAVAEYVERVRSTFDQLRDVPSIGLNTTGGLDTRTVLAALVDRGIRPRLMYGVGNSGLTNTREEDLEASEALAHLLDLELYRMNWSGRQPFSAERLRSLFLRYGFPYTTYGASDGLLRELEGAIDPYPVLHLGGYSPAFTNMKLWERAAGSYSIDDIVNHFIPQAAPRALSPDAFAGYRRHIETSIRDAFSEGYVDVPEIGASAQTFVQARLSLYLRPESIAANFFNEFAYYLAPFLTKRLYDPLLTMPLDFRKHDSFQLRLIDALAPQCLQVPVFSGLHAQVLDLESFTMTRLPAQPKDSKVAPARSSGLARRIYRRLIPPSLRAHVRSVRRPDSGANGRPAEVAPVPTGSSVDAAIRVATSAQIASHHLGALFGDLGALDLRRLHRAHLVLVGVDEVARVAAGAPEAPPPATD